MSKIAMLTIVGLNGAVDTIAEATAGAGVTVDGLRLKDAAITPVSGGAAWADLSNCATGEADTIVAANLADAWSIRESATTLVTLVTTTGARALNEAWARTAAGVARLVAMTLNHATNTGAAFKATFTQLSTARTAGNVAAIQGQCTSLAGDTGSPVYADFEALAPSDGGGTVIHSAYKVAAGHDRALDLTACATGEGVTAIADNLAVAWAVKEAANTYFAAKTTDAAEASVIGKPPIMCQGASTAAAGTTTADATALPSGTGYFYPTTAADDTKGVRIAAADDVANRHIFVGNGVSNKILKVYPPSGGTINGAAADAAFSSASGKGVQLYCISAGVWSAS